MLNKRPVTTDGNVEVGGNKAAQCPKLPLCVGSGEGLCHKDLLYGRMEEIWKVEVSSNTITATEHQIQEL